MRLEINATYLCNAVCRSCNRLVGLVDLPDSDMTPDQLTTALANWNVEQPRRFKVSGGEPLVNPRLRGLVLAAHIWRGGPTQIASVVHTNGVLRRFRLPVGWSWKRSKLDDKLHDPFLVSPADVGLEGEMLRRCGAMRQCGHGLDAYGYAACGVIGPLARLLRVDPYADEPVTIMHPEVCRHCVYALPLARQYEVFGMVSRGELPAVTQTHRNALAAWRDRPFHLPRRFEPRGTATVQLVQISRREPGVHAKRPDRSGVADGGRKT